jgi:methionine sulfoxide reductase heme-binding subunit
LTTDTAGRRRVSTLQVLKPLIFAAALLPAAALVYGFYTNDLTANPLDYITDQTGTWALAFLVISLSVTPLRRLTGWNPIIKLRRMLGLFSFFYALLHMLTWVVLLNFFDVREMVIDVAKRPFITIGMATFLILLTLAVTSNQFSIRRLGRRWQSLHRLAYAAAIGAVIHFWWLVKEDITEPRRWLMVVMLLLGLRVWWSWKRRAPRVVPAG